MRLVPLCCCVRKLMSYRSEAGIHPANNLVRRAVEEMGLSLSSTSPQPASSTSPVEEVDDYLAMQWKAQFTYSRATPPPETPQPYLKKTL